MKKILIAALFIFCLSTTACTVELPTAPILPTPEPTATATPVPTVEPTATVTPVPTVEPTATATPVPTVEPSHSPLYVEGVSVEQAIRYFNEVCIGSEYGDNSSVVRKWSNTIRYFVDGGTQADRAVIKELADFLNSIEGFPGMTEAESEYSSDMSLKFCSADEVNDLFNTDESLDGAVTFWFDGRKQIYECKIRYRETMTEPLRRSVILEEIYNGLGPIQDTVLRADSISYQYYAEPQELSDVDKLILRLMYHPQMQPGFNAEQAAQVIRQLYY